MTCPKCGSSNCIIVPVSETKTKYRGCCSWFLWIILAMMTCGLILIIPLITNRKIKTKTREVVICQNCGKRWNI